MKKQFLLQVKYPLTLWAVFFALNLFATDRPITGTILDFETKEPLPFANIGVLGKHKGTVSNSEGVFILDREDITEDDTLLFQYMGYHALKIKVSELEKLTIVYLHPSIVNLSEIQVVSKNLSAEEIIKLAYKNFDKNHSLAPDKQRIFFHKYGKVPFQKENKVILKETNFVGLDKKTFDELLKKMPNEFIEYQDALVELYSKGDNHKLVPVKGISLEEGSQESIIKEFENKLGDFFNDIEKSMGEKDIYYKIRTGILSRKIGNKNKEKADWNNKDEETEEDKDTLNYTVQIEEAKEYLRSLLKNYTSVESENLEFINHSNKYEYTLEDVTEFNDELVYKISFMPKKKGLFEGTVYISTSSYAILQLDFAFAKGKKTDTFKLFGYKHSTDFREAHIIFEKGNSGYFVKYLYAKKKEFSSLDRDFAIMKKEKRFFIDKELNEMKIGLDLSFNTENSWEMLVLERDEITPEQYEKIKEPSIMKFKKEYVYTPEMWGNRTVIVPATELKKYKRK
jgi:hypothetical protein